MPRVTRRDVATHAGVSPSTVSNVLNGRAEQVRIAASTAERVRRAAEELGYVPQASARALRGGVSRTLGLLLAPFAGDQPYLPYVDGVLNTAIPQAAEHGYRLLPMARNRTMDGCQYINELLASVDVAGILVEYDEANVEAGCRLRDLDVPVVWVSFDPASAPPLPGVGRVDLDEPAGVRAVLDGVDFGGRPAVAIVAPNHPPRRLAAARSVLGEHLTVVQTDSPLPDSGAQAMRRALEATPDLGLAFCSDDLLAAGAVRACAERGIVVPGQVSIVGFGDDPLVRSLGWDLRTVRWPLSELTVAAVDGLVERLRSPAPIPDAAPLLGALQPSVLPGSTARLAAS